VVLGSEVGLDPFALCRATAEDVLSRPVAADEADGFDGGLVDDEVDRSRSAVDHIKYTVGKTSFLCELCEDHGCTGVSFGGFENETVTGNRSDWDGPKWDHSGEVCNLAVRFSPC